MKALIMVPLLLLANTVLAEPAVKCEALHDSELQRVSYGSFKQPKVKKTFTKGKYQFHRRSGPTVVADVKGNKIEKTLKRKSTIVEYNPFNCKISQIKFLSGNKKTTVSAEYCRTINSMEVGQASFMVFKRTIASVPKDLVTETIDTCKAHLHDF